MARSKVLLADFWCSSALCVLVTGGMLVCGCKQAEPAAPESEPPPAAPAEPTPAEPAPEQAPTPSGEGTATPGPEATPGSSAEGGRLAFVTCEDPRKTMCTREYRPVCGEVDTGIRCIKEPCPSTEKKTYPNACEACADPKVAGYFPIACDAMNTEKAP